MLFLHGATSMGSIVAALYFLRFWRDTRDRLFVLFSVAFAVLALNRAALALSHPLRPTGRDQTNDRSDGDTQPTDAGLPTHDGWVRCDSREFLHVPPPDARPSGLRRIVPLLCLP
jgi:hypothetical protein